ncbi:hypothetical protein UVI_02002370 [Ustilaginoidea virens]|uniref:peptidylprolyl isomerase n=1 Tax=Ustilaginoidea virens TaxID=1159556 RepID=A0A1B5L002_USTVR|nr:hypothetical protein UVI_02002370 [Ustilaginoidea virens]
MKSTAFLSALAAAAVGLVASEELKIDVTHKVACERKTKNGDKVSMHYRGTLGGSGKKFDASYDRGEPLTFTLGTGQVIKGFVGGRGCSWDQGLLDMCIGEKSPRTRTLTIPPELGYGDRGVGPIPAGSVLVFETELVGIAGVPSPDEAKKEGLAQKAGEKIASVASEAAEAVKIAVADTDGGSQEHEEL